MGVFGRSLRPASMALVLALGAGACASGGGAVLTSGQLVPTGPASDGATGAVSDPDTVGTTGTAGSTPLKGFKLDFSALPDTPELETEVAPVALSLVDVVDATRAAPTMRYEIWLSLSLSGSGVSMNIDPDQPFATGTVSGAREYLRMDLGPMLREIAAATGGNDDLAVYGNDLSMEFVLDGQAMYMRAPMFARLADAVGSAEPMVAQLAALDDGWALIDLARAPWLDPDEVSSMVGASTGGSFDELLDLLRSAGVELGDVGPATIQDTPTRHLSAVLNMGDVLAAQGLSTAELGVDAVQLAGLTMPIDVFVDAEQRVRRIVIRISLADIPGAADSGESFEMRMQYDAFDFGATVDVQVPTSDQVVVDITDTLAMLAG